MPRKAPPTHEQAVLQLARKRGLLRTSDVAELGVPTVVLTRLVRSHKLTRAGRGLFTLTDHTPSAQRSLAEVSLRTPRGVVCLLSALRVHEIGTQAPFEVWLALPPGVIPPRIDSPALRVVRMSGRSLTEGIDRIKIEGVRVPVFTVAKTVADCFKFRNKIGLDVAREALRETLRARRTSVDELWRFAAICRVTHVMRPYLEAMT
jgi:predicted transcriptional regulator of viral defense system